VIEALTGQGIDVRHACRTLGLAGEIADVHKASGGTYGQGHC
jgi:hypothetical protein